jgi:hypothetical protein
MTQFNPENKDVLTYGEALEPAMNITDQDDADQYKKAYIDYQLSYMENPSMKEAERIVNTNLGYFAGYYSDEVRERVERLFKCSYPIFGTINSTPASAVKS